MNFATASMHIDVDTEIVVIAREGYYNILFCHPETHVAFASLFVDDDAFESFTQKLSNAAVSAPA